MEALPELERLAAVERGPCVTVYLDLRRSDPASRESTRTFVRTRIDRALRAVPDPVVGAALRRVLEEAERRIEAVRQGALAIVSCTGRDVFRTFELEGAVENEVSVGPRPSLRQLALATGTRRRALVVMVSHSAARIFEVVTVGVRAWTALRYQCDVESRLEERLGEAAEVLTRLVAEQKPDAIVVAGMAGSIDAFLHQLPDHVRTRVADVVALPAEEVLAALVRDQLRGLAPATIGETIDLALAGGPAALGVDEVLDAAAGGRLLALFMAVGFHGKAGRCRDHPWHLARGASGACPRCGGGLEPVDLGLALERVAIDQGGTVEEVPGSETLARFEGVAAMRRW